MFDGACPAHSRGQGHGLYGGPEEKTKPDAPKVSERFGNLIKCDALVMGQHGLTIHRRHFPVGEHADRVGD